MPEASIDTGGSLVPHLDQLRKGVSNICLIERGEISEHSQDVAGCLGLAIITFGKQVLAVALARLLEQYQGVRDEKKTSKELHKCCPSQREKL